MWVTQTEFEAGFDAELYKLGPKLDIVFLADV